jgi:ribosomal protein S18 acetylase RimI-like enzyme
MMTKAITFETNTASLDAVITHLKKCSNNFVPDLAEKVDIETYAQKIKELAVTFEAWDAEELVGLIAAYCNDQANFSVFITNVSTVAAYTGKGIASQLLQNCLQYAVQKNFKEVQLRVSVHSKGAIHLYDKAGFQVIETVDDEILMKKELVTNTNNLIQHSV